MIQRERQKRIKEKLEKVQGTNRRLRADLEAMRNRKIVKIVNFWAKKLPKAISNKFNRDKKK
jgi:hypothetical protein